MNYLVSLVKIGLAFVVPLISILFQPSAKADVLPGLAICRSDWECEMLLRNTESNSFRCNMAIKAKVQNSTGREAFVWSDEVRSILVEANQEVRARFDFSREMEDIWATDSSYGNLSPTGEVKKTCLAETPGSNTTDFSEAGFYLVTTGALKCNKQPKPCNNDECSSYFFEKGEVVRATHSRPGIDSSKPWLWDGNAQCWVRGSSAYLKPSKLGATTDIVQTGLFEITIDSLSCNATPSVCNSADCRVDIWKQGERIYAARVVNQLDAGGTLSPWFSVLDYPCYVRASSKYMKKIQTR